MATLKYYVSNTATPYTPATIRGTWTVTQTTILKLDSAPSGTSTAPASNSRSDGGVWTALISRFVSDGLAATTTFTTSNVVNLVFGGAVNNATNTGGNFDLYIYITTGDSDTPRGTILTNTVFSDTLTTTGTGRGNSANLTGGVTAQVGDRIVVEVGWQKSGSATGARTGNMWAGDTGADLTLGSTSVTTLAGWITITTTDAAGASVRGISMTTSKFWGS